MARIEVQSSQRMEIIDITGLIQRQVSQVGWGNGAVHLFCAHTTCALTINEGYDPAVCEDMLAIFERLAPPNFPWKHLEGNSDAHLLSSLLGVSLLVPLQEGKLILGRWQRIFLFEGDGPRKRAVLLQLFGV